VIDSSTLGLFFFCCLIFSFFVYSKPNDNSTEKTCCRSQFIPLPNKVFPQTRDKSEYWRNSKTDGHPQNARPSVTGSRAGTLKLVSDHVHFMMNVCTTVNSLPVSQLVTFSLGQLSNIFNCKQLYQLRT
jgi:hypothetical protein